VSDPGETARPLLAVSNVEVIYDHVILVLKGVSLRVPDGGIVALLGANGAGKSTTLKAISGLLRTERGDITKGSIELRGVPIHQRNASEVVRQGIVQVMEGRHVFEHLTVEENLLTGGYTRRNGDALKQDLDLVYTYFPRLTQRRGTRAGYISGGEQQMLAIGRALMARPRLILFDEPSLGLAPTVVETTFRIIADIRRGGTTVLMVEQNAYLALRMADRGYVMETGRIVLADRADELLGNDHVRRAYLGV
jgi:branched-chain amino acid transport system ATP-binding protein